MHKKPVRKPKQPALNYAVWLLGRRDYGEGEMEAKLISKLYSEEEVRDTMQTLKELKYVDDSLFSARRIKSKATYAGWGKYKIAMDLKQKGLDEATINAAFAELDSEEAEDDAVETIDWQQNAVDLMQKKYGAWPEDLPFKMLMAA